MCLFNKSLLCTVCLKTAEGAELTDNKNNEMNSLNKICWLCFEKHDNLLEIYGKQGTDLNVETILQAHFWFEVGTFAAKHICENCWKKVESFHLFYNFVKSIHQRQLCETKALIDNGLVCSFKEEPIDIKEVLGVFTDYADIADSPASSDGWMEVDSDTTEEPATKAHKTRSTKCTILAPFNSADSSAPIRDVLEINSGATEGPATISRNIRTFKPTILASFDNPDSPDPRSNELGVDSGTTNGPATVPHKTRICKRKRQASSSTKKGDRTSLLSQYFNMACDLCDMLLPSWLDTRKHYKDVHNIKEGYLICCNMKYDRLANMLSHCEWHMNPDAFKCNQCSKSFRDKRRLTKHFKSLHAEIYSCNDCNQKFPRPNELRSHQMERHSQSFKCPICQKCCTGKMSLRRHILDKHSAEDEQEFRSKMKQFECDICSSRFTTLSCLRDHIKRLHVHSNRGHSHICEICAKPFASSHTYKQHYFSSHTNESVKVKCDICGKWFKNRDRICRHMRRMHNSKKATCKVCGRVFSNQESMQNHIRSFHRDASSECIVCGKMIKTKQGLKEHMAIHAGITDLYTCTFCPKTCRSNANMYTHRKRAHPAELEEMKRNKRHLEGM